MRDNSGMKNGRALVLVDAVVILLLAVLVLGECVTLLPNIGTKMYFASHSYTYVWELLWNCRAIETKNFSQYWASNAMYPYTNAFAMSENLMGLAPLACPIWWTTHNPVLTFNLSSLLLIWFTAVATYLTFRKMTGAVLASLTGTLIFAFYHWTIRNFLIGHIHIIALMWVPVVMYANWMFWQKNTRKHLILMIGLWFWTFLICVYIGILLAVFLALWNFIWFWYERELYGFRKIVKWVLACAVVWVLMIPIFWKYYQVTQEIGTERTLEHQMKFTGKVWSWLATSEDSWFWHQKIKILPKAELYWREDALFPGVIVLIIFVVSFFTKNVPKWLKGMKWTALVLAIITLGPYARGLLWKIPMPYIILWHIFPPMKATRNPNRWSIFVVLFIGLFAAYLLSQLRAKRRLYLLLNIMLLLGIGTESFVLWMPEKTVSAQEITFYKSLQHLEKPQIIIELPYDMETEGRKLFDSSYHWNKIVNGFNGVWPAVQFQLENELQEFPTNHSIKLLQALDVGLIIIDEDYYGYELANFLARMNSRKDIQFIKRIGSRSLWQLTEGEKMLRFNPKTDVTIEGPSRIIPGDVTISFEIPRACTQVLFNPKAPARFSLYPVARPWIINLYFEGQEEFAHTTKWFAPGLFNPRDCNEQLLAEFAKGKHGLVMEMDISGDKYALIKNFPVVPLIKSSVPLPSYFKLPYGFQAVELNELQAKFHSYLLNSESKPDDEIVEGEIEITNPGPYYWFAGKHGEIVLGARLVCDGHTKVSQFDLPHDLFPGDSAMVHINVLLPKNYAHCSLVVNCMGRTSSSKAEWFPASNEVLIWKN